MESLEKYWKDELLKNVRRAATDLGPQKTCISGVTILKYVSPVQKRRNRWTASVGLIIQGAKEIEVGDDLFLFSEMNFIASPLDLPVSNQIVAASAKIPYLAMSVALDPTLMMELTLKMEPRQAETSFINSLAVGGIANPALIESFARLSRLLNMPSCSKTLEPLLIKEIYFHLLNGPEGVAFRQFVENGSVMHKMSKVISTLHNNLARKIDVGSLAKAAHMSRSIFFKNFRLATRMSPIQYQKQIRLLEARRLISDCGETVESAGFKVGYKSPSQFSREYLRYFGNPPKRDAVRVDKKRMAPSLIRKK